MSTRTTTLPSAKASRSRSQPPQSGHQRQYTTPTTDGTYAGTLSLVGAACADPGCTECPGYGKSARIPKAASRARLPARIASDSPSSASHEGASSGPRNKLPPEWSTGSSQYDRDHEHLPDPGVSDARYSCATRPHTDPDADAAGEFSLPPSCVCQTPVSRKDTSRSAHVRHLDDDREALPAGFVPEQAHHTRAPSAASGDQSGAYIPRRVWRALTVLSDYLHKGAPLNGPAGWPLSKMTAVQGHFQGSGCEIVPEGTLARGAALISRERALSDEIALKNQEVQILSAKLDKERSHFDCAQARLMQAQDLLAYQEAETDCHSEVLSGGCMHADEDDGEDDEEDTFVVTRRGRDRRQKRMRRHSLCSTR